MKIKPLVTTKRAKKKDAAYQSTDIPGYDGNPLIEALPPIKDVEQAIKSLIKVPKDFDEKFKYYPAHKRSHLIRNFSRFFTPLDIHLDLERRFSCAIRMGYLERNPLELGYWSKVEAAIASLNDENLSCSDDEYSSTTAYGFNIVGISGIGKSQTISRLLEDYPQVIFHNSYQANLLTETQLVWLKLDCPFDGSIKGLCINFFQYVDALLGTNYYEKYVTDKNGAANSMLPDMASVAMNHHLGILVIDEIQRLSSSKSGGEEKMLNFFVQLVNKIGLPVCLVGTYKALNLLSKNISQMRRGTGQGDLIWDRMKFDDEWKYFVNKMFNYLIVQYEHSPSDLEKISKTLYEETQGIIDLAIKALMFSQERAIELRDGERITPSIIKSVVKDNFQMLAPALKAFKEKDKEALIKFDDAYPKFLNGLMEKGVIRPLIPSTTVKIIGEISDEPEVKILIDQAKSNDIQPEMVKCDSTAKTTSKNKAKQSKKSIGHSKRKTGGELANIIDSSEKNIKNPYELLKENGVILSTDSLYSNNSEEDSL